jgi:hypothetical protein
VKTPRGLDYVGFADVAYFAFGVSGIASRMEGAGIRLGSARAVVVRDPDEGEFYVFTPDEFRAAVRVARARGPDELHANIARKSPVRAIQRPTAATGPSVVLRGGKVAGVVLTSYRMASRTPGPDPPQAARGSFAGGGGGPPDPPDDRSPTILRTPHVDAPDSLPKDPGARFEIAVRLDDEPFRRGESGQPLEIEAPPEVRSIDVGVVLTASPHLAVVGQPFGMLTVERDRKDSDRLHFTIEIADAEAPGDAAVTVQFLYRGRPSGRVDRAWSWQTDAPSAPPVKGPSAEQRPARSHVDSREPDVTVLITRPGKTALGGDISEYYQASVTTTLVPGFENPIPKTWPLPTDANEFIRNQIALFESALKTPEQRRRALDAAGPKLWDAAPEVFQQALRKMIEAGRPPRNIYIATDEPSLPWELMMPSWPDERGGMVDRKPLGVEFAVARWIRDDNDPPPPRVVVDRSFVIAPVDDRKPLNASQEVDYLRKKLGGRRLKDTSVDGIDRYLRRNSATLLHFICHGSADKDDDVIYLADGETLSSREARRLQGFISVCRKKRPFVFINACETGFMNPALVGGSGFPKAFGEIGAKAVIAPLWSVEDADASAIALELYERALADEDKPTIAEVLRDLRARAYAEKDPKYSYAAYAFYGDPWAQLERRGG